MIKTLKRGLGKICRDERGITGLETAIILIAFVVVASVFAYTVLSAGIFSAERGKEAVYAGLQEARSSMEPRGSTLAYDNVDVYDSGGTTVVASAGTAVTKISFVVSNAVAGEPVDLTPPYTYSAGTGISASGLDYVTVLSYSDQVQFLNDMAWTVEFVGKTSGDYLLEAGEKAEITVWLVNYDGTLYKLGTGATDPFMDDATKLLGKNEQFTVEVKAPKGAVLTIQRTTPARLDAVMNLF
ncbi:MAG TPA: hypothetical protein G4O03_03795 [Dehalococcoidia bacterium]|nr:hypothetical protein [Dehalococcoidia bacterium]